MQESKQVKCNFRVGYGYDVHRFEDGRDLVLGGVKIPYHKGLKGHSDADVVIHAICDALLGSAALRDIGYHFPDTNSEFKGIDSKILLQKTMDLLHDKGFEVSNIDVTVMLEKPKLSPYIGKMQEVLDNIISCGKGCVSVKATTTEKLGFAGREEGIAAAAVALVYEV